MSQNESNYTKGFLFGALAGGIAGAITALLLAPKSGVELRRDIADTSEEYYGKASDYFRRVENQVEDAVVHTVNEGKQRAQVIMTQARDKAEKILRDAEHVLNDARNKASSASGEVKEKISNVRDAARAGVDAFKSEMKTETEFPTKLDS